MQINSISTSPQRKHAPQQNFGMIQITKIPKDSFEKLQRLTAQCGFQLLPGESDKGVRSFIICSERDSLLEKKLVKKLKKLLPETTLFARNRKDIKGLIPRFLKNLKKDPDIKPIHMEKWAKLGLNLAEVKKLITEETSKFEIPNAKQGSPLKEFCLSLIKP